MENLIDFVETSDGDAKAVETNRAATTLCFLSPPRNRDSFDNNPFDRMQNLADRADDPFEYAEQAATYKTLHHNDLSSNEVQIAKLLSLSDDDILEVDGTISAKDNEKSNSDGADLGKLSDINSLVTVEDSPVEFTALSNDLETESPPITMYSKWSTESGSSATTSAASSVECSGGPAAAKHRKSFEFRKRLLKLSVANSTFNSPISRNVIKDEQTKEDLSENVTCSPVSALFSKAAQSNSQMLSAESPLKLYEEEPLSEGSTALNKAEMDFEADLEMLNIPILKDLRSPLVEQQLIVTEERNNDFAVRTSTKTTGDDIFESQIAALRAKQRDNNNGKDITQLIQNLKSLIGDLDVRDNPKKQQASALLDNLSKALTADGEQQSCGDASVESTPTPQTIVRQGTFDIELQPNNEQSCASTVSGDISLLTHSSNSVNSVQLIKNECDEMPEAMIRSSATYDGEPTEERNHLELPEVRPISPFPSPPQAQMPQPLVPDLNDIVEQLGKLLEQHQLTQKMQPENGGASKHNISANMNPTFIVVMNTPQMPLIETNTELEAQDNQESSKMRRRSQSLSLHDKLKIVHLPSSQLQTTALEQVCGHALSTELCTDSADFKTPARSMRRRNSFSTGTPHTPNQNIAGYGRYSNSSVNRISASESTSKDSMLVRRSFVLNTHHEAGSSQQKAIVRPINNMNAFKPDLKKKSRKSVASNSILKSTAPLKATIPVKKLAPAYKSTPLSSSAAASSKTAVSESNVLNSSMAMLNKSSRMPPYSTSTPMSFPRSADLRGVSAVGFPTACSTPAVEHNSPTRRVGLGRYSNIGHTPTAQIPGTPNMFKRRTLNEFKIKSPPGKSHVSGTESSVAFARNSKLSQNAAKTANKSSTTSVVPRPATTRALVRGVSANTSSTGLYKNKENKQP